MNGEMIAGLVRHLATIGGGMLVANGTMDEDTAQTAIGAIVSLSAIGWSLYNKHSHKAEVKDALMTPPPVGGVK